MKNKHNHIRSILIAVVCITFLPSCFLFPGDRHHPQETEHIWDGYTKATVINYKVDGCSWILKLEDEKKLQALNLKQEFQKDNLKVWIKYEVKKGGVGICMAGEMINLTEIELRK